MMMKSLFTFCSFALVVANISNMQAADATKNIRFEKKSNGYIEAIDNKNNEFIGNISYSVPHCSIDYVWVIEKMRNKGIGSHLFKQAINDMSNCERIQQTVNPTTVNFCLKQGAQIHPDQVILEKADPIWWAPSVHMIFDNKQQRQ